MEKIYSEKELLLPALKAISSQTEGLTTTDLINILFNELKPIGQDLEILKGRGDNVFSQKVRNLISHKTLTKYVDSVDNRMIINNIGLEYIGENSDDEYSANIESNDDFRDENEGYSIPEKAIELDNMYLSVSDLKRKYDRLKKGITANTLKLDESFQRYGDIWSRKNKSLFIESIILNIPIPSIYLSEDKEGTLIVIDGRQRLSTLFDFMDDKFKLYGLSIMNDLNGKKFSNFTGEFEKFKSKIEDRSLHIAKIRYGTEETFIIETFERVNTKGARLNAQEIRNALHQGKSTKLINNISDKYNAENEIIDKKRMKDKYLILRYLAMKMYYNGINNNNKIEYKSITDYLASVMKIINQCSDDKIIELEDDFTQAYNRAISIYGKSKAFRLKENTPINMVMFEITLLITSLMLNKTDEEIKESIRELISIGSNQLTDIETLFEKNIKYHRDSKENVEQRLKWIKTVVESKDK
jgi:hypothetical protein